MRRSAHFAGQVAGGYRSRGRAQALVSVLARRCAASPARRAVRARRARPRRGGRDARGGAGGDDGRGGPGGRRAGQRAAGQGAGGSGQLVQRRGAGRAVREARCERSPAARAGAAEEGDRHVAVPGAPVRRGAAQPRRGGRARPLGAPPLGPPAAGLPAGALRGARRPARRADHERARPAARPGRRGRPAHGDAVRRRDPVAGPRRVGLRREDPPLPPAGAAAARAGKRRRRARPVAGPARRLPQLRLGGAAAARHGALVVGRGSGDADRAGANRLPGIELRLRADRAHGRAARRGRLGAPRRSTPAAARR